MPHSSYVLLVDADKEHVAELRSALADVPIDVAVISDGKAALKAVLGFGPLPKPGRDHKPVMIIVDLDLPVLNGHIVLRLLRTSAYGRGVPIVALVSTDDEAFRRESSRLGATEIILKPIGETTIKALLEKYVAPKRKPGDVGSPPDP